MLVYANFLVMQGPEADEAVFKAIGGWLKEQLGFGLHPEQLREDGEYNGSRGSAKSWLRIYATNEEEPQMYSWVLKNGDQNVRGRQWVTELGVKQIGEQLEVSCILRTEEQSTLVAEPVPASRPRLIKYLVSNVQSSTHAELANTTPGLATRTVGENTDSYRALLVDIERRNRDYPIVLVSPTADGEYLIDCDMLQADLVGLAQVVRVVPEFDSYEMEGILGRHWSAWSGSINVLHMPTSNGFVRGRFFLSDVIAAWGEAQHQKSSQLMSWVTGNTNIPRLRKRIRPEGVMQLSLRRRLQAARTRSDRMDADQLRDELERASQLEVEQSEWIELLEHDNSELEGKVASLDELLEDEKEDSKKKGYEIQLLKDQLGRSGQGRASHSDFELLLELASRADPPRPIECLTVIESLYGDRCIVLESAKKSAEAMNRFEAGRRLLDMLLKLVGEYRTKLSEGGDSQARLVFGQGEYAAKESETVMANKAMRRARTFDYKGAPVEMFRHLKIGVDDDATKTIRVHFHWDGSDNKIVIGYCGEHLPVKSH